MKRFTLSLVALFVTAIAVASSPERTIRPIYLDPDAPIEERVEDALSRMTLREKIAIIHAQSKFSSPGVPRLGIAELRSGQIFHGFSAQAIHDTRFSTHATNVFYQVFVHFICFLSYFVI